MKLSGLTKMVKRQLPIDCAIQQDDTSPYYFATVQMDVTCPSMSSENNPEIEELI